MIIQRIIELHGEEASSLWSLRDVSLREPHRTLTNLAELDERIEAHLDGLRIAGEAGWDVCRSALVEAGEAGGGFAAAVLAFEGGNPERISDVLTIASEVADVARGLVSALGWLPYEQASRHIKALMAADSRVLRRIGLAAASVHRRNPGLPALQAGLASDDAPLRARAVRAGGELGLVVLHIDARANLKAKDPAVRFWAAWSNALLIGHKDAVAHLQDVAEAGGPFGARAAQMAMRRLAPNDAKLWLKRLAKEMGQKRTAIIAAGAFADPEVIPFLIDQMKAPALARVAGESFCLITGACLDRDKLEGQKPDGFEAGPTEDPEDDDVTLDADLNLPWPDPALVQKWWGARQGAFARGTRYLLGRPIAPESLRLALEEGYQRQRAAAALELAILNPGRPLFEVRAPGARQRNMLKAARASPR